MDKLKSENHETELKMSLRKQVNDHISTLTTEIPNYSELSEEGKKIVDEYIARIDIYNAKTIDEFGKSETENIYGELNDLIGTLKTHDTSIQDMFAELMLSIDENSEPEGEKFVDLLKKSPIKALRSLKDKAKRMAANERYRRAKVLTSNVLEVISSLKAVQDAGRPTNKAFTEILDDFRTKLTKELNSFGQDNAKNFEEK